MAKAHEGMPVAELPGAFTQPGEMLDPNLQPMEQPQSERTRTIEDLFNDIFGG